jgi:hypothetical protein
MSKLFRWLQMGFVPFIGLLILWMYWTYAAYQDVGWLPISIVSLVVVLMCFTIVLFAQARQARASLRSYTIMRRRQIRLTCILLGLGLPVLSVVASANGVGPTSAWDFSGIQFLAVALVLFIVFESLALLAHVFIPRNLRK